MDTVARSENLMEDAVSANETNATRAGWLRGLPVEQMLRDARSAEVTYAGCGTVSQHQVGDLACHVRALVAALIAADAEIKRRRTVDG